MVVFSSKRLKKFEWYGIISFERTGKILNEGIKAISMSQKEKLIQRLLSKPKDFSFQETSTLLNYFGYEIISSGKTGGSRVAFSNGKNDYIRMHKPHPRNILKSYQVNDLINDLIERGLL